VIQQVSLFFCKFDKEKNDKSQKSITKSKL